MMESYAVLLTFESVDKILWCCHSVEASLAVISRCFIFLSILQTKLVIFVQFLYWPLLRVQGLIPFFCQVKRVHQL